MILLSFDIEEFDMPLEYGKTIEFTEQIAISKQGTKIILELLKKNNVRATFFSTVVFAQNAPELIAEIINDGHEIASHTYYHSKFEIADLKKSKEALELQTNTKVVGLRMPRMYLVDNLEVEKAGYIYNSSINPTYLPGRYNNLNKPKTYFYQQGVIQIPASVTPLVRFPLFWISFHNIPSKIYFWLCRWALKTDGYLNIYFHPWEFTDLNKKEKYNFPGYISKNTGKKMAIKMNSFISRMKKNNQKFVTFQEFITTKITLND